MLSRCLAGRGSLVLGAAEGARKGFGGKLLMGSQESGLFAYLFLDLSFAANKSSDLLF